MNEPLVSRQQAFTTIRQDLVTALLSLWLIAGIVVDGWAHVTRGGLESFFTPWHALFYSGFLAVAAWLLYLTRSQITGPGVPTGYRLGISGLVIFAAGGVGDLLWHQFSESRSRSTPSSARPTCCFCWAPCSSSLLQFGQPGTGPAVGRVVGRGRDRHSWG
jgi:hypothetical protein